MTIYKAGTMLTLTNELGTLRGKLAYVWDTGIESNLYLRVRGSDHCFYTGNWTITPDRTLPTTPGSVVRADWNGEPQKLVLSAYPKPSRWYRLSFDGYLTAEQITNWTLLFDAAEVSE